MIANHEDSEREEDALHVFLLMGEDYRISRSIRAQWFFQQFNSTLPFPKPEKELIESSEELEVLSIIPNNRESPGPYRLLPSTHVTFIGRRYRFVFCLDISPSSATVDIQSGTVITDEAFSKLKNCLCGLVAPFSVDGNSIVLSPELYITVLAYTSILNPEAPQVLVQGCLVTQQNVNAVLDIVHDQIKGLEDFLAKTTTAIEYPDTNQENNQAESDQEGLHRDSVRLMSPEVGPVSILRNALLALQLLPSNASAGAIVITDGVFALPDASTVDSLLAQLRASTVCCSFIKLGSGFHAHCSLGYVPHCDLMQFIAMATSGAYLAKAPPVSEGARGMDGDGHPMNLYHRALLCLNFQKDFDLSKIDSWIGDCLEPSEYDFVRTLKDKRSMSYALSKWEQNAMQPSMRKRHLERKLHTSITSVLSVRLREGYSIQDVSITKGGKQLQVKLTIPWKHNVQIEYLALSAWPILPSNCITHVEVTTEAPYEFLSDVTYPTTQHFTSGYRTLVVKRFRQMIRSLQNTDEMLVHLQSFSSNPSFYTIPESAKNGVPLFYLPPNSTKPVLSLQDARKSSKSQKSHFAKYWKSLLSLDTTEWQRWMHFHKIGLVLEHDVPLPDNLYLAMANNQSSTIQCRVALRSLSSVCRNWSSFVLLENNSYVKFINNATPDDPPSSFCIAHITIRGPCIVIKVAFLGGTPGNIRSEIVSDLRSKLSEITAPLAVNVKSPKVQAKTKNLQRTAQLSSQRSVLEKPCAIMYNKSLDRILVRYERIPQDLFTPFPEVPHYKVYDSVTGLYAHRTNENHMKTLCQYLHHHRWIWPMQDEGSRAVADDVVARVLSTLTELRLQEGFKFVSNSAGIITMAKEFTMKDHLRETDHFYTCIIQYVLFPPYHQHSDLDRTVDAIGDWEIEGKLSLAQKKQKLNVVTEVWAEPQFGILTDLNSELKYLEGLQYNEVPHAIFQVDVEHVSALLSFDHLRGMCNDRTVTTPERIFKVPRMDSVLVQSNWVVEQVPFPFDVISLLPKTRQVEMVFSSLKETLFQGSVVSIDSPNEKLFKLLLESMERLNDREVTLTDFSSLRFIQHLQNRKRNDIPLPFPGELCDMEQCIQSTSGEDHNGKDIQKKSVPSTKWRCFVRAVTACGSDRLILTFLPASFKHVRLMAKHGRKGSSSTGSAPRSPHRGTEKGTMEASKECGFGEAANIEEKHKSSLLPQSSLEDGSLTPTPTSERSEISFLLSQQTDTLPESNPQTATECTQLKPELSVVYEDEKISESFQDTEFVNDQPVFHDQLSNEDRDSFSFNIPIYCYDCPISALQPIPDTKSDREVMTEEAKEREDIFQDFTQCTASIVLDPFSSDEIPKSLEAQTKGRFGLSKDLLFHTHAVHDMFFRSVVTSTFASLQKGHSVSMQDVHLAVDACEENVLEVDITEFIHTLCGHYVKKNASKNNIEEPQVSKNLDSAPCGSLMNARSKEHVRHLKGSLSGDCESVEGLHKSIRAKFMSILGKYFKAIPPSGEFFFYCPHLLDGTRKSALESFSELESNKTEQIEEDDSRDKDSDIGSDTFDDVATGILMEDATDIDEEWTDFESDGNSSGEFDGDDDKEHSKSPLFLHLTCSLRNPSSQGQPTTTVSINTLPVCLGELVNKFEDDEDVLDPFISSVRITLDLICLTLPSEPDYALLESSARSAPSRCNSFSSTSSPVSMSPQERRFSLFDFRRQDSKATSHDIDGKESMDPLYGLLHSQQKSMNSTCDAIRWLLQDEIVSELRHIGPVTEKMLETVEKHVTQSKNPSSCFSRDVRLQFVCSAEQSLSLFFKEFERITLQEYSLKSVEKYYFLTSLVEKQHGPASLVSPEFDSPDQIKSYSTVKDNGEFGGTIAVSEPASLKESQEMGPDTGIEVGKHNTLRDELNTPVNGNTFASSASSTPEGKLFLPSPDDNTMTATENAEDDRSTASPRTPRQDKQNFNMMDECLQFWLVLKILEDKVTIFFHRRESDDAKAFCASRATGLVEMVTNTIHEKCLVVNQRMLLHELYETKVCSPLLFPKSDEDIWRHDDPMSVSPQGVPIMKSDSKGRVSYRFVQVQFLFQPGHFRCRSVWHTHLPVHQRLMDCSGRTGISRGLKAINSVLDSFGVSNRKDMFVYKDSSGAVFYFRLFESLCSNDSPAQFELHPPYDDDDEEGRSILSSVASLAGSRTSSQSSLVKDAAADGDDDETESKSKGQLSVPDRDRETMSDSEHSLLGVQAVVDKSIVLHVYGVDDPGPEITVELVEVLQNRLNEAMLEVLSLLLSRNPNCKLTYSDVRFIQPQGQPPKTTLTLTIPPMDVNFLCPLSFYLRQNLLQMLHTPRYTDSDPSHRFRAVSGSKVDATGNNSGESRRLEPEAYLYNRPQSSGGKGLACISVSVFNSRGGYIYIPCGKTACNQYAGELENFEQFTEVFVCEDKNQLAEDDIMVQFSIWERGDIGLEQLSDHLKLSLRHALCDLLAEYYLLTAPLSEVPEKYRRSQIARPRSCSEPRLERTLIPKSPTTGSCERSSKRRLDFGNQSGFRGKRVSVGGHRRTSSAGNSPSSGSSGSSNRTQFNPFLSQQQSVSSTHPVSRQSTFEDEVFKLEVVPSEGHGEEQKHAIEGMKTTQSLDLTKLKSTLKASTPEETANALSDVEQLFESLTPAEIQESLEYTSQPGTPVLDHGLFASKVAETPSEREKSRKVSAVSAGQSLNIPTVLQDTEARRRREEEVRIKRIQFENGERGELHPSLQGLGQDMFALFFDLGVSSVYRIDGKLVNNFAPDPFLAEFVNLISSICPDIKPRVFRECSSSNTAEGTESGQSSYMNYFHYFPAREPLKVQDTGESSADKSGKRFAPLPNSSNFFVVVGRNVDQWRASMGFEEDLFSEDPSAGPKIRPALQCFKPLDPNAPKTGRISSDSNSLASLPVGGVPRQKFLLVTISDKDVNVFTYNWAADLNHSFDKQLHRLLNWSNARCHLTSCLLSQKLGLFHHTLFADINKGKASKEMNPFCLSANDEDVMSLISRTRPPSDRERALPRQLPPSPNLLVFDEVLREVTPPKPLYRASYFHNRDIVKRHGYQFKETRFMQIKKAILEQTLDDLYLMWQRVLPSAQISEDKIETLKRSSRMIHYCAAPLLFHPDWRREHSSKRFQKVPQQEKEEESKEEKPSSHEEAWHQELKSAYVQLYVQYMQSLRFIVVQTRPQSPKPNRRHIGRSAMARKAMDSSASDGRKETSSKGRKESQQCYLQRSSPGGIMLLELGFQGRFFVVRLYSLGCSQIPSGRTVGLQMSRLFVEDCTRYREYIHLLSFNYDFHLCKAQMYLNGSQLIFNKGYAITDMLKALLLEYPQCPFFAKNRACEGEIAVPSHPGISPQDVFNYLVKNASKYEFSTLPLEMAPIEKAQHVLLGTQRVLTQEQSADSKAPDILRENNEYDITFVVTVKESPEEGVVCMAYVMLMTSRRDLFPKLTLDWLRKKSPSSSSLYTMNGARKGSLPESEDVEQEKGSRVRFTLPNTASSGHLSETVTPASPGEFHRSASSPHSLFLLGSESSVQYPNMTSFSEENIVERSAFDNACHRESNLLTEAFNRAHDHLVHVVCRAQAHCNRDLLWQRLLVGGTGREERESGRRGRRRSEVSRTGSDASVKLKWIKAVEALKVGGDQASSSRLSFDDFKQLLSVVVSRSLKDEDPQLISLLSMGASWYLNLLSVIIAKFPDTYRMFTSEDNKIRYLVILNANNTDMFILFHVNEQQDSVDVSVVFREEPLSDDSGTSRGSRLLSKKIRSHVYSVINSVCFHLWTRLLPP